MNEDHPRPERRTTRLIWKWTMYGVVVTLFALMALLARSMREEAEFVELIESGISESELAAIPPGELPALIKRLESHAANRPSFFAEGLRRLGFSRRTDRYSRMMSVRELGKFGEQAAATVPTLLSVLNHSNDPWLELAAAESIAKVDPSRAVEMSRAIAERIDQPSQYYLELTERLEALGRLPKTEKAVTTLNRYLTSTDVVVRVTAARALFDLGELEDESIDALKEDPNLTEDWQRQWVKYMVDEMTRLRDQRLLEGIAQ